MGFLEGLNERQKEAVLHTKGPLLVLAGAGSGKTKVLTKRVSYLISEKLVSPWSILAITFTNKAAKEMKKRITDEIGADANSCQISTFHAFGVRVLRKDIDKLGYDKNFVIIDSNDQKTLIKQIMKDKNIDSKKFSVNAIREAISGAKSELIDATAYQKFNNNPYQDVNSKVYLEYEKRLQKNNSVDFDDLICLPLKMFREFPKILDYYQNRYKYVLVDEYQDTNYVQYSIVNLLANKHKNLCVVGDSDQSIYSWRGANIENILNFEKDYPDAKVIMLEQNYRSTKKILDAANRVIKVNKYRKDKNLWTEKDGGESIVYYRAMDEKDEAEYVVDEIIKNKQKGIPYLDNTILYRTNAQSRIFEEVLLRNGIQYKIVGSLYFYDRKEIKDLLSYLRLLINKNDDLSIRRVINVPKRSIGLTTVAKLADVANVNDTSLYNELGSSEFSSSKSNTLLKFKGLIDGLLEVKDKLTLTELVDIVISRTRLKEFYNDGSIKAASRLENIDEFLNIAQSFEEMNPEITLEDFLVETSLVADMSHHQEENDDYVMLMTIHSAKGLEFPYVYLVGMEERLFPHSRSIYDEMEMEEERRLCYVAVTRAEEKLYISNAQMRLFQGQRQVNLESRFIKAILTEKSEINRRNTSVIKEVKREKPVLKDKPSGKYLVGDKVKHTRYGEGMVVSVKGDLLDIAFASPHGVKKISSLYSSLSKL